MKGIAIDLAIQEGISKSITIAGHRVLEPQRPFTVGAPPAEPVPPPKRESVVVAVPLGYPDHQPAVVEPMVVESIIVAAVKISIVSIAVKVSIVSILAKPQRLGLRRRAERSSNT